MKKVRAYASTLSSVDIAGAAPHAGAEDSAGIYLEEYPPMSGPTVRATAFRLSGNSPHGVLWQQGKLEPREGLIEDSPIGLEVGFTGFEASGLGEGVQFRNHGKNIQTPED